MGHSRPLSRRRAVGLAAGAATLPLVHIRTAGAAGKLSVGFWDHWVPAGNAAMKKLVAAWAEQNKVDVSLDFITSVGSKILLTAAAEAQAHTGHDIMAFPTWEVQNHADALEPVDDLVGRLTAKYGPVDPICAYLARNDGHWRAVPTSSGSQFKPCCGRIDLFKQHVGIDLTAMYPPRPEHTALADQWTYDTFLMAAQKCQAAGKPFSLGLGQTSDSVDWVGAMFAAYGAVLVDSEGNIRVKSDEVRQVMEYAVKFAQFLPPDVYSYDDASDNRALIGDKSALIADPPSAWAVAKRDAPQVAAQCWTFTKPSGPKGRFVAYLPFFWGVWSFSRNKSAAKALIEFLMQREQVEARCDAVDGYDIPPFDSMSDFKVWERVEPPPGTVYNYPLRPWHNGKRSIAAAPAPPDIAVQIYNQAVMPNMIAKVTRGGQTIEQSIAWAQNELEGFVR